MPNRTRDRARVSAWAGPSAFLVITATDSCRRLGQCLRIQGNFKPRWETGDSGEGLVRSPCSYACSRKATMAASHRQVPGDRPTDKQCRIELEIGLVLAARDKLATRLTQDELLLSRNVSGHSKYKAHCLCLPPKTGWPIANPKTACFRVQSYRASHLSTKTFGVGLLPKAAWHQDNPKTACFRVQVYLANHLSTKTIGFGLLPKAAWHQDKPKTACS